MTNRLSVATIAAVLLGAAVPSIAWGRGLVNTLAALALLLVVASLWRDRHPPHRPGVLPAEGRGLIVALMVVTAAWLPSVALSIAPASSAEVWARVVVMLGGGVLAHAFLAANRERATLALKGLMVVAAAASAYALLRYSLPPGLQPGLRVESMDLVFKPSSNLFALLVPVALWGGWRLGGRWQAAGVLVVVGAVAMLIGSDSRAALAGLTAGVVAAGIAVMWRRRWWWVAIPMAAMIALALAYVYQRLAGQDLGHLEIFAPAWLIDVHRQHIWTFVLGGFTDNPVFGVGMGAARHMPGAMEIIPLVGGGWVPSHPHNWLVEVLGETGLVGALPTVALVGAVILYWLKKWLRTGDAAALALFTLLVVFFSAGLFNFSLWRAYWLIGLIVPYAIIAGAGVQDTRK